VRLRLPNSYADNFAGSSLSFDLPLFSEAFFMQRVNYIHQNPVRAGRVERAEDYRWSSVRCWKRWPREDEPLSVDLGKMVWRRPHPGG